MDVGVFETRKKGVGRGEGDDEKTPLLEHVEGHQIERIGDEEGDDRKGADALDDRFDFAAFSSSESAPLESTDSSKRADHHLAVEEDEDEQHRQLDKALCKGEKDCHAHNAICHWIEHFAKLCHLIIAPCKNTVENIRKL